MVVCPIDKDDAKKPPISLSLGFFLHAGEYDITLCVQNIGIGFARDIKFTGDLSFKPINPPIERDVTLEELEPFKSGIDYLAPGQRIETFLFQRGQFWRVSPIIYLTSLLPIGILANIKDQKTFTFEMGNWD